MQPHLEKLDELKRGFYEAATEPRLWSATLEKASSVFGADGSCIIAFPSSTVGAVWSSGLDGLAQAFFGEGWHANNERLNRALPLRHRRPVMTESDLFTREELERHPFNAEFINVHGFRWATGCFLSDVDGWNTALTLERLAKREPYGTAETEALRAIMPDMRCAAEVASRLALAKGDGMLDAFDKMCCAAALIGCTGKVNRINPAMERILNGEIRIVQGVLMASHRESNDALQRLIGGVLGGPYLPPAQRQSLAAIARRDSVARPYFALGMPIVGAAQDVFQHAKALVLLIDPDAQITPPELILRHVFSLTRAETRLAVELARGASIAEFAEAHNVAVGTARNQMKAILAKTGTHRQAELAALLTRLSVVPAPQEKV